MAVCVGGLIPPCSTTEFAVTYQVDAAAAFREEFATPFIKHFFFIKGNFTFGRVEYSVKVFSRVIAAAYTVEELGGLTLLTTAETALGKRIYYFGQTDLGVVALHLVCVLVAVEGIFGKVPS